MITLELDDGSTKQFNLSPDKEQGLYDLWFKHKNKALRFNTSEEKIEIKLSEIENCYIGEKKEEETVKPPFSPLNDKESLDMLKGFFGFK